MKKAELDPNFTVEEALNIPSFHAINILNFGERRQPAFLVHMLAQTTDRYNPYDNSFLTKRHAQMYGRHWKRGRENDFQRDRVSFGLVFKELDSKNQGCLLEVWLTTRSIISFISRCL